MCADRLVQERLFEAIQAEVDEEQEAVKRLYTRCDSF